MPMPTRHYPAPWPTPSAAVFNFNRHTRHASRTALASGGLAPGVSGTSCQWADAAGSGDDRKGEHLGERDLSGEGDLGRGGGACD